MNRDRAPLRGAAGGMSPWGNAVTRLHQFQGEHPEVQFSSPVMGRYGQYTALVPPGAIPGEAREITVTNPDLYSLMDELDVLFDSQSLRSKRARSLKAVDSGCSKSGSLPQNRLAFPVATSSRRFLFHPPDKRGT